MYRDFIEAPVKFEYEGKSWWYQIFRKPKGSVSRISLYDENGNPIVQLQSLDDVAEYLNSLPKE